MRWYALALVTAPLLVGGCEDGGKALDPGSSPPDVYELRALRDVLDLGVVPIGTTRSARIEVVRSDDGPLDVALSADSAVLPCPASPWCAAPVEPVVDAGVATWEVRFEASVVGVDERVIVLGHEQRSIAVTVRADVADIELTVEPSLVEFDRAEQCAYTVETVTVRNTGRLPFAVANLSVVSPFAATLTGPSLVHAGGETTIELTVDGPSDEGRAGDLDFTAGDQPLRVHMIAPPAAAVPIVEDLIGDGPPEFDVLFAIDGSEATRSVLDRIIRELRMFADETEALGHWTKVAVMPLGVAEPQRARLFTDGGPLVLTATAAGSLADDLEARVRAAIAVAGPMQDGMQQIDETFALAGANRYAAHRRPDASFTFAYVITASDDEGAMDLVGYGHADQISLEAIFPSDGRCLEVGLYSPLTRLSDRTHGWDRRDICEDGWGQRVGGIDFIIEPRSWLGWSLAAEPLPGTLEVWYDGASVPEQGSGPTPNWRFEVEQNKFFWVGIGPRPNDHFELRYDTRCP